MKSIRVSLPVSLLFAVLLCWASLSHSAEDEAEVNCDKNQMIANVCARRNFGESDKQLNDAYKELMGKLKSADEKLRIRNEQRAWIKSRDRECGPILKMQGSIRPMQYWICMKEQTDMRSMVLDVHLSCAPGDCSR